MPNQYGLGVVVRRLLAGERGPTGASIRKAVECPHLLRAENTAVLSGDTTAPILHAGGEPYSAPLSASIHRAERWYWQAALGRGLHYGPDNPQSDFELAKGIPAIDDPLLRSGGVAITGVSQYPNQARQDRVPYDASRGVRRPPEDGERRQGQRHRRMGSLACKRHAGLAGGRRFALSGSGDSVRPSSGALVLAARLRRAAAPRRRFPATLVGAAEPDTRPGRRGPAASVRLGADPNGLTGVSQRQRHTRQRGDGPPDADGPGVPGAYRPHCGPARRSHRRTARLASCRHTDRDVATLGNSARATGARSGSELDYRCRNAGRDGRQRPPNRVLIKPELTPGQRPSATASTCA